MSWESRLEKRDHKLEFAIYDVISPPMAAQLLSSLDASGADPVNLRVNSPGGDVLEGMAMINDLKASGRSVTAIITGAAFSMASAIAVSAAKTVAHRGSWLMIHEPWSIVVGGTDEMRTQALVTEKMRDSLADIYTAKTGLDRTEILRMMAAETWLTADEAKTLGFVDEVLPDAAAIDTSVVARHAGKYRNMPKNLMTTPGSTELDAETLDLDITVEETVITPAAIVDESASVLALTARLDALTSALAEANQAKALASAELAKASAELAAIKARSESEERSAIIAAALASRKWLPTFAEGFARFGNEDLKHILALLPELIPGSLVVEAEPSNPEAALVAEPRDPAAALASGFYDRRAALRRTRPELFEQF